MCFLFFLCCISCGELERRKQEITNHLKQLEHSSMEILIEKTMLEMKLLSLKNE